MTTVRKLLMALALLGFVAMGTGTAAAQEPCEPSCFEVAVAGASGTAFGSLATVAPIALAGAALLVAWFVRR